MGSSLEMSPAWPRQSKPGVSNRGESGANRRKLSRRRIGALRARHLPPRRPLGMEDDLSPVVYALSNPVSFTDPMGTLSVREAVRGLFDFMKANADVLGNLVVGAIPFLEEILDITSAISGRDITSWIKGGLQGEPVEWSWWERAYNGAKAAIKLAGSAFGILSKVKKAFDKIQELVDRATEKAAKVVSKVASGAKKVLCKATNRGCFVAGTLVLMASGNLKAIEQVQPGDYVASAIVSPVAGMQDKKGSFEVTGISLRSYEGAIHRILVGVDQKHAIWIEGTPEHPFWLPQERIWKPLAGLKPGDCLSGSKGLLCVFEHKVRFTKKILVFNLRIPGSNAYRVGSYGILAHNRGCPKYYEAFVGDNGELIIGKRISKGKAVSRLRKIEKEGRRRRGRKRNRPKGVYTPNRKDAKDLIQKAPNSKALHEKAHGVGYFDHYHSRGHGGAHAWYGGPKYR